MIYKMFLFKDIKINKVLCSYGNLLKGREETN